ncbi:hypothetical protein PCURB6_24200 [Paenibacillus curdlanolyticus]|nr:hypothetical protein PCURB6_24200 [Paenibacillus curdlanolyticus]
MNSSYTNTNPATKAIVNTASASLGISYKLSEEDKRFFLNLNEWGNLSVEQHVLMLEYLDQNKGKITKEQLAFVDIPKASIDGIEMTYHFSHVVKMTFTEAELMYQQEIVDPQRLQAAGLSALGKPGTSRLPGKQVAQSTNVKIDPKKDKKTGASNGCNCFTAGTKVLTDEGEKPIEEIEVGDRVLAKSDETGEVAYKEVVGLFQKQADEIYYVHLGDEIIEVTGEHPFWLDGKGWTLVKDLKVGDLLVSSDGSKLAIDKIEKEPREATVYNFEVADFSSYFVSNLGIWVHNCEVATKNNYRKLFVKSNPGMPSNYQVHHTLPQKYESIMKDAGINIHETQYLRGVDPSIHSKITTAWTKWEKSLGRTPTAREIQDFAKEIDKQYGQYWYNP